MKRRKRGYRLISIKKIKALIAAREEYERCPSMYSDKAVVDAIKAIGCEL